MKSLSSKSLGKTSVIYDKQCPICDRYNLTDAYQCWNCGHEFSREKKEKSGFTVAQKALIGLTVFMVFFVTLLSYLAG